MKIGFILISLVLPLILLLVGITFYNFAPKKINSFSGYRTTRSMKNLEIWKEANRYSSRLLIRLSLLMLILIILGDILVGKSVEIIAVITVISTLLSIIGLGIIIALTERHLKNMFGV